MKLHNSLSSPFMVDEVCSLDSGAPVATLFGCEEVVTTSYN